MKKYEYKAEHGLNESELNFAGENGWELVCIYKNWFYFKRLKQALEQQKQQLIEEIRKAEALGHPVTIDDIIYLIKTK